MGTEPEHLSPVRAVVARTGVPAHLLRAWERRYGAVEPRRTSGGQRRYSEAEVERIRLLRDAVAAGETISAVAKLSDETLRTLVRQADPDPGRVGQAATPGVSLSRECRDALGAVEDRDPARLREILVGASLRLPLLAFLEGFVAPLLRDVGQAWAQGHLGVAEEHLASQVIRDLLAEMRRATSLSSGSPVVLCATPAGQRHEFGALLAAVVAGQAGWSAMYLGPDVPPAEIVRLAASGRVEAVAVGVLHPQQVAPAPDGDEPGGLEGFLQELRSSLPSRVALYLGGHPRALAVAGGIPGVVPVATLTAFLQALEAVGTPREAGS